MIIILSGASHAGKTLLSQKLLERYHYSVLSQDLLKMGLIRSGKTTLTPEDDREMTPYLWGIVKEMIKTAVENGQNLIVEGCYVPFDWKKDFTDEYLPHIRCYFLIFSEKYIKNHFNDIKSHANDIEQRLDDEWCTVEALLADNKFYLDGCIEYGCEYMLIDEKYEIDIKL